MYRSPCCGTELSWYDSIGTEPVWPAKCPTCGKKFHDIAKRKFRWLSYLLLLVGIIAAIASIFPQYIFVRPVAYLCLIFSIVVMSYDEWKVYCKGVLVETTASHRKKHWTRLMQAGVIILLAILWEISSAL